jgi:hypothetical protein
VCVYKSIIAAGLIFKVFNYAVSNVGINSSDRGVEVITYDDYEFVAYLNVLSWQ